MDNEFKLPVCTTSFQKEFMEENQVSIIQKIKQSINKPNRVYLGISSSFKISYFLNSYMWQKSNYTLPKFNKFILSPFQNFIPKEKVIKTNKTEAIILEEYAGKSLKELILNDSSFINIYFITELALKLLKIFEALHKNGIVFANLRPSNILIKKYNNLDQFDVFLINFENLIHFQTLNEQKFKENNEVTKRRKNKFSSVRLVKNEKVDFGTDLESLFYVLLYCVKSKTYYDFCEKKILIEQMKLSSYKSKLISTLTSPLYEFLLYLVTLPYKAAPSYKILHHVLESLSHLPKDDLCPSPLANNSSLSFFSEPLKRNNLTQVLESSEEDSDEDKKSESLTPNNRSGMNQKSTCDFTSSTKFTNSNKKKDKANHRKSDKGANCSNDSLIDESDFDDRKNDFSTPNNKRNNKLVYQRYYSTDYDKNGSKMNNYRNNNQEFDDEIDETKTNFDLKKYYFPGRF